MIESIGRSMSMSGAMSAGTALLPGAGAALATAPEFSSVLQNVIASATATVRQGEAAAIGGIQGTAPVQQVVEQVLEAERTVQVAIAIRDKLVGAYLEITRMQI